MAGDDKDDSRTNKNDFIGLLIRAGLIAVAGYGVYRILRGFSSFKAGQQVSDVALLSDATTETDLKSDTSAPSGTVRRAYLKGLGRAENCQAPAAPRA